MRETCLARYARKTGPTRSRKERYVGLVGHFWWYESPREYRSALSPNPLPFAPIRFEGGCAKDGAEIMSLFPVAFSGMEKLQRGRTADGAEIRHGYISGTKVFLASTGPHRGRCGDANLFVPFGVKICGFNGAAPRTVRRSTYAREIMPTDCALQRGRTADGAEMAPDCAIRNAT